MDFRYVKSDRAGPNKQNRSPFHFQSWIDGDAYSRQTRDGFGTVQFFRFAQLREGQVFDPEEKSAMGWVSGGVSQTGSDNSL